MHGCIAQNLAELSKFAPNFLPVLFNIFGEARGGGETDAILGVIAAFAVVADAKTLNGFFKSIMKKLLAAISSPGASDGDEHFTPMHD